MQVKNEKEVLFWDRLSELKRVKEDGEVVSRGSIGGINILRIHQGGRGSCFMTASCHSQSLLNAEIITWPSNVSDDGMSINLWLFDYSLGRQGYKREFILTFIDELGASRFFETFTDALPSKVKQGKSYWEMRNSCGSQSDDDESIVDNSNDSINNSSHRDQDFNDIRRGGERRNDVSENSVEDCNHNDAANEELAHILEMEENWGESQSLFDPIHPFE